MHCFNVLTTKLTCYALPQSSGLLFLHAGDAIKAFFQKKVLFYFFFMDKVQLSQQGMPQQGKSLPLTAKSLEVTVPRLINLGRMKG